MFEGWSKVVSVRTFAVPRPVVVGCFVDDDATAGRRKGGLVEVKYTVEVVVGQDFGVGAGLAQHI